MEPRLKGGIHLHDPLPNNARGILPVCKFALLHSPQNGRTVFCLLLLAISCDVRATITTFLHIHCSRTVARCHEYEIRLTCK